MKRLVRGSFLFLFLFLCSMQTAAAASIRIFLDDKAVSFAEAPFIENDRVLVPMRGILESLGYSVAWQEESKTVLAEKDEIQISLHPDEKTAIVNGKAVSIDAPAKIRNGRTFVPLRFLAEYSGAEVTWNQSTSSVSIHSAEYTAPEKTENNDSVVYIQTNKMQGSGIVLSADGLIATNYHVIKGAATAQFVFADGTIYQGTTTVVGLDTSADIALLRIEKTDLSAATPAFSYKVGDAVTSIGSPGGARNTVSTGTINGYDTDVISTSAVIAPGSSGGALFNSTGEVIGMTSFFGDSHYFCRSAQCRATPIPPPHRRICAQGWRRTATHTFHGLPFTAQTIIMYTSPSLRMGHTRASAITAAKNGTGDIHSASASLSTVPAICV